MRLAVKKDKIYVYFLSFVALLICIRSIYVVSQNYVVPLFWDQWNFTKDLIINPSRTLSINYLFVGHNEHVIATTKILIFIDYLFFNFTNAPLVASVVVCAIVLSLLVSILVFHKIRKGRYFVSVFLALSATSLSMAQWENLLWGFQPQFYLVIIGAVLSLHCALRTAESKNGKIESLWFLLLIAATAFCIFSMGNGIAIPISILIFFIFVRYRLVPSIIFAIFGFILAGIELALTSDAPKVGDSALRTPLNMMKFFFTMIGGPITNNAARAYIVGVVVFFLVAIAFLVYVGIPWFKRKPVDGVTAALVALASFLFASAAAAAYGRAPLGVATALSSRYSTPMLLLMTMPPLIIVRQVMLEPRPITGMQIRRAAALLLMIFLACFTTLRPDNKNAYSQYVASAMRAAYFVASNVEHGSQLQALYPSAADIRKPLALLRAQQLNIFSPWGGLPMPSAHNVLQVDSLSPQQVCGSSSIDSVTQLSATQWQIGGWVADSHGRTPAWLMAVDQTGQLLGFTKPLEDRPDVTKVVGAEKGFRGFLLPVGTKDGLQWPLRIGVIANGSDAPCLIDVPKPRQEGLYLTTSSDLATLPATVEISGDAAEPGLPRGLSLPLPYPNARVFGTWVSGDDNSGTIQFSAKDSPCQEIVFPVMRGPSADGIRLEIEDGVSPATVASVDMKSVQPNNWTFFEIPSTLACHDGKSNFTLKLIDEGKGWGAWAAIGFPGTSSSTGE